MKRIIVLSLLPTAASAHAGFHADLSFAAQFQHLLSQPDHLALLAGLAIAAALYAYKVRSK